MSKNKRSMRVLIAQDVIKSLAAKKIIATLGEYVGWDDEECELPSFDLNKSLGLQIKEAPPCNVCAKGAAFIAAVDRFDTLKAKDVFSYGESVHAIDNKRMHEYLHTLFEKKGLDEIEAAFEGWSRSDQVDNHGGYIDDYLNYRFTDQGSPDIRLAMIMRNVIDNGGEFMPQKFIDEIKTGYDLSVFDGWLIKYKKENKENEQK